MADTDSNALRLWCTMPCTEGHRYTAKKNVHTDQDTLNVANLEDCRDWLDKNHNEKKDLTHPQHYLSTPVVSIEGFVVATNSRGSQKDIPLHCRGRARLRTGLSYYNLIKRICVYAEHFYHGI